MGRKPERGAVLITLVLTIGLLAGGALLLRMQLMSSRSADLVVGEVGALNCAEAGLAAARPFVAANVGGWTGSLCNPVPPRGTGGCVLDAPGSEPAWLAAMPHDLDGDGSNDLVVSLVDNDDELPLDPLVDSDHTVQIVATCTLRGARAQITEMVHYDSVAGTLSRKLWLRTE